MGHKLSPRLLQEIGRVTLFATLVEQEIALCAAVLLNKRSTSVAQVFLAQLNWRQSVDIADALGQRRFKVEELSRFRDLLARAERLTEMRNKFVHSHWGWMEARFSRVKAVRMKFYAKKKKGLKIDIEFMTIGDVKRIADELESLLIDLQTFLEAKFGYVEP